VEKKLSITFGLLIGGLWIAEIVLGNVGGARAHAMAPLFAVMAVAMAGMAGLVSASESGSLATALRVGAWSGLLSAIMMGVVGLALVRLFHDAMMRDPANVREFMRGVHHAPTQAELSSFLYSDMLGGVLNHLWIGPTLGVTVGGIGAGLALASDACSPDSHRRNPARRDVC
jgi:hypothetical protein